MCETGNTEKERDFVQGLKQSLVPFVYGSKWTKKVRQPQSRSYAFMLVSDVVKENNVNGKTSEGKESGTMEKKKSEPPPRDCIH